MNKNYCYAGVSVHLLMIILVSVSCISQRKEDTAKQGKNSITIDSVRYLKQVFDSISVEKDIVFTEVLNEKDSVEKLRLDVYTPYGDSEKNRPAILWVHGGGFTAGNKTQGYISRLANEFTKLGYVSISTDYRLRQNPREDMEGTISDAVNDVMEAFFWVKENSDEYGINKEYLIIGGGSAGGILSTNLCYKDDWNKEGLIAFVNLWGSPGGDRIYSNVDKNDPPTVFIHGMADTIVPYANCLRLAERVDSAGIKYHVFPIENAGHTPVGHMDDIVKNIKGFLFEIITESPEKK